MGQYEVVGGIISPVHDAYGKKELVSATHRLNMIKISLQGNEWVKLSDWESRQETWTRTRQILQYHQVNNVSSSSTTLFVTIYHIFYSIYLLSLIIKGL